MFAPAFSTVRRGAFVIALAFAFAIPASAQDSAPLRVVGFSGSSNWPIYVVLEKAFTNVTASRLT